MGANANLERLTAVQRRKQRRSCDIEFYRQQVVDRQFELFGNSYFSCFGKLGSGFEDDQLTARQRAFLLGEVLERIRLMPLAFRRLALGRRRSVPLRCFTHIEESFLLDRTLVDEIIWTAGQIRAFDLQLVIELTGHPLQDRLGATPRVARELFGNLYALLDHGIELSAFLYPDHASLTERMVQLGLCRYLRLDVSTLHAVGGQVGIDSPAVIFDAMAEMLQQQKVTFIAERVATAAEYQLVRQLPFGFFRGDYFSPAEPI